MLHFKTYSHLLLLVMLITVNSCTANENPLLKAKGYIISSAEDETSQIWGEYLYNHLKKRCLQKDVVAKETHRESKAVLDGLKNIYLEVKSDMNYDYCIEHTQEKLHIRVCNSKTAIWIVYQLIGNIADVDSRFDATDLPPAIIDFENNCRTFDFSYREPYFAPNLNDEYSLLIGTNNVERDWGLWGHSLSKVIKDPVDDEVYSLVGGIRNKEQFSFSSPALFRYICDYIIDNYGDGEKDGYRFMIMPNDNGLVCTCPSCVALGNTPDNATPAVTYLINKLAERFPAHKFFTTGYRTTSKPPVNHLSDNAGVFISTIDLPKGVKPDQAKSSVQAFQTQLDRWKEKTSNIYLWDYAANFDDYLTPLPIIYGLQKQFQYYKVHGVKGIFLNASGYDYSPFEDVKTFIAGALMMDTQINIENLCLKYFQKEYPVSHKLLSDYYLYAERQFDSRNKPYDMYGGINQIVGSYLDIDRFIQFYDSLKILVSKTENEERYKLQRLLTALTYTRLQIAYVRNNKSWGALDKIEGKLVVKPEVEQYIENLEAHDDFQGLVNYKESDGRLDDYIMEWKQIASHETFNNKLMGVPVKVLSGSDENNDAYMLNDGMPGFTSDYHQGWFLSSTSDIHVGFFAEELLNSSVIKLRFLRMEKHSIYPPERVDLIVDNKEVMRIDSLQMKKSGMVTECMIPIDFSFAKKIELKFIRKQAKKSVVACDEIVIK